jgi:hypothetical protein
MHGRKSSTTLKAEAHFLRISRLAILTSQHTVAMNQTGFWSLPQPHIITPCVSSQAKFDAGLTKP